MSKSPDFSKLIRLRAENARNMSESRNVFFRILTLIEDHPLSVPALIEHLGITEEEYNTWEADTGDSFMTMLDKIAEFYEVPVEYLTEGKVI